MLIETKIIQRHASHAVMAQRYEVMWPNGSTVGLHAVWDNGVEHAYLRAIEHQPLHWIIVDLRDLAKGLEADLKQLPKRDAIGVVFHTLRLAFSCAAEFKARAIEHNRSAWHVGRYVGMAKYAGVAVDETPPPGAVLQRSWLANIAGVPA